MSLIAIKYPKRLLAPEEDIIIFPEMVFPKKFDKGLHARLKITHLHTYMCMLLNYTSGLPMCKINERIEKNTLKSRSF
jgi:hypothetical protein